ncbi:MAG: SLC13 family permease [Candidatus Aenigmarchaeota archaeon]|nr:SLC13 family permease [Candidatus Aenigmarchaeota archaeon]
MIEKLLTLVIFIACYSLAMTRKVKIAYTALAAAGALILLGIVTPQAAFFDMIEWNVMGIYWGFMMISIIFMQSGMPAHIAGGLINRVRKEKYALISLCILTAVISSFMANVGTVLMVAPIAIEMAKKLKSSLFPYMVAIAISSNVVTTVTMIADPPALVLAMETGMKFFDFYWFQGKVGLGVITIFGVAAAMLSLLFIFRKMNKKITHVVERGKLDYIPTLVFVFGTLALVIGPYFDISPGLIGVGAGIVSLIVGRKNLKGMMKEFDWDSFLFIGGIFIVVGSIVSVGLLSDFVGLIGGMGISNASVMLAIIIWVSVAASSFIDNVPYTILMIPVCNQLAATMGISPFPFLFGMLIGTGIGGNITPIGATANVYACGMLEKHGYKVKLKEYLKISLPFSILAVMAAHIALQLLWM